MALAAIGLAHPASVVADPPPGAEWRLVFSDEFDGSTLDAGKWNPCVTLGTCFQGAAYYTADNLLFGGGKLTLEARLGGVNPTYYYSGAINTEQKFYVQYGHVETRAQLPAGKGLWPAFWGHNPAVPYGEIDVFENLGRDPMTIYTGIIYYPCTGDPSRECAACGSSMGGDPTKNCRVVLGRDPPYTGPNFSAGFHVFGVDWQPGLIVWYVDGVEVFRTPSDKAQFVPAKPLFIIANLAVGAPSSWGGAPDVSTQFPADLTIDYIRVWKRCPNCDDGNGCTDDICDADATCRNPFRVACLAPITELLTARECGDGALDPGEGCDDGNMSAGDGCSGSCVVEDGWSCSGQPSQCIPVPTSVPSSTPSPTNAPVSTPTSTPAPAATHTATRLPVLTPTPAPTGTSTPVVVGECGDGSVDPGEDCDDWNTSAGDCCDATCRFEPAGVRCGTGCALGQCDGAGVCQPLQQ